MSDVSKTNEARQEAAETLHKLFPGYVWNHYLNAVDALEAATRVPVQGEPNDDREALKRIAEEASVQQLKDSIEEWRKAIGAAYGTFPNDWELEFWHAGYKHGALAIIEHQISRATVPDATTERELEEVKEHREKWMARAFRAETERNAAVAALDEAPEPEWEYAREYRDEAGYPTIRKARDITTPDGHRSDGSPYWNYQVLRRRKAGPWLLVEGEKP